MRSCFCWRRSTTWAPQSLVVTHEQELVEQFTKRVIAIDDGKVINDGMDGYYHYEEQ